jgi:hypothetical protein
MQPNRRGRPTSYSRPQEQGMSKFAAFMMLVFLGMIVWIFRINESLKSAEKENTALKTEMTNKDTQINILQNMLDSAKRTIEQPKAEEIKIVKVKKQKKDTVSAAVKNIDTVGIIINFMNPAKEISDTLK